MGKKFRDLWNSYNNYSKSDRNAILVLSTLILLTLIANVVVKNLQPKSEYSQEENLRLFERLTELYSNKAPKTLFIFNPNTISPEMIDSLDLPENIKLNLLNYRKAGGYFTSKQQLKKIYGMNDSIFGALENYIVIEERLLNNDAIAEPKKKSITGIINPNAADYNQLIDFGFNSFQARNIVNYRLKSGIFKNRSDLLKIYGIDSAFFKTIESNIQIESFQELKPISEVSVALNLELNSADSAKLIQLPGIGSVYAKRIIKYRDLLGGFNSTTQLLEIYNFPPETYKLIEKNLTVDTLLIKKIRLNFAEYPELIRHPYFNRKLADAVLKYRKMYGPFQNVNQLKTNELIDSETFEKIKPYLSCR